MNNIGGMLKKRITEGGLTVKEVSDSVGVSATMINLLYRNKTTLSVKLAAKIGKEFGKEFGLALINIQAQERLERDVKLYNKLTKGGN